MDPSPSAWQPFSSMASPVPPLTLLDYSEAMFRLQIIYPQIFQCVSKDKESLLKITVLSAYLKLNTNSLISTNVQSVFTSPTLSHKWLVYFGLFESGSKHGSDIACGRCAFSSLCAPPPHPAFLFAFFVKSLSSL